MWMIAANFRRTHSPSWLAWSESWRPPGAQSLHSSNEPGELSQWLWSWWQHHKHCHGYYYHNVNLAFTPLFQCQEEPRVSWNTVQTTTNQHFAEKNVWGKESKPHWIFKKWSWADRTVCWSNVCSAGAVTVMRLINTLAYCKCCCSENRQLTCFCYHLLYTVVRTFLSDLSAKI